MTSLQVRAHLKADQNTLCQPYSTIFIKKSTEKRQIRGTPSGSQPALRSRKISLFCSFSDFYVDYRREITEKSFKQQKGLKTDEKSISTIFQMLQAPETWSKYTTLVGLKVKPTSWENVEKGDLKLKNMINFNEYGSTVAH